MAKGALFHSTVAFPDRPPAGMSVRPTLQDEEMLIQRLPRPSSAVTCWVPSRLTLPSGRPHAIVRRLDVSGAALFVEHAVPNDALVSLTLPLPHLGDQRVPARLVQTMQRAPRAVWVAEIKFQLFDSDVRSGIARLVQALKYKNQH